MFKWLWNSKKDQKDKDKAEKEQKDTMTSLLLTTDELMPREELGIDPEESCGSFDLFDTEDTSNTCDTYDDTIDTSDHAYKEDF